MNSGVPVLVMLLYAPCASMAWAAQADLQSQHDNATSPPKTLETVVVTGSHIRNIDLKARHPWPTPNPSSRQCLQARRAEKEGLPIHRLAFPDYDVPGRFYHASYRQEF